jgi:hypothetical protein
MKFSSDCQLLVVKATDSNAFRYPISVGFARIGSNPVVVACIALLSFWTFCLGILLVQPQSLLR